MHVCMYACVFVSILICIYVTMYVCNVIHLMQLVAELRNNMYEHHVKPRARLCESMFCYGWHQHTCAEMLN